MQQPNIMLVQISRQPAGRNYCGLYTEIAAAPRAKRCNSLLVCTHVCGLPLDTWNMRITEICTDLLNWVSGLTQGLYWPKIRNIYFSFSLLITVYSPVVTICTTSLTFNNSTFCPHSVFMCFVWISEQTAIISLYNINWLVCITEI